MSKLFCIFDTNSLMLIQKHLGSGGASGEDSIKDFLSRLCTGLSQSAIRVLLPYIVLQELDGLKSSKVESVAYQSRNCTAALQAVLQQQQVSDANKVGEMQEKIIEIQQKSETLERIGSGDSNDEHILDCCLYWIKYHSPYLLLITNDKNLSIKALAHRILVLDPVSSNCLTSSQFLSYLFSLTPQHWTREQSPSMIVDDPMPSADEMSAHISSIAIDMPTLLHQIYTILTGAFTKALHVKLAAKGLVEKYSLGETPLTLENIFLILEKEHGAAFDCPSDYPPYFEKSQIAPILMIGKDIDRSIRQNMCTLTKGDIKAFIKKVSDYLYICDGVERTNTMNLLDDIVKYNL